MKRRLRSQKARVVAISRWFTRIAVRTIGDRFELNSGSKLFEIGPGRLPFILPCHHPAPPCHLFAPLVSGAGIRFGGVLKKASRGFRRTAGRILDAFGTAVVCSGPWRGRIGPPSVEARDRSQINSDALRAPPEVRGESPGVRRAFPSPKVGQTWSCHVGDPAPASGRGHKP